MHRRSLDLCSQSGKLKVDIKYGLRVRKQVEAKSSRAPRWLGLLVTAPQRAQDINYQSKQIEEYYKERPGFGEAVESCN